MDCAPLPDGVTAWRDERIRSLAIANGTLHAHAEKCTKAAIKIQSTIRGWLARSKYLRHCTELEKDVSMLNMQREASAAMCAQKALRMMLAKRKLQALRANYERLKAEGSTKPKAAAKAAAKGSANSSQLQFAGLTPSQILVEMNRPFIEGMVHYLHGRWEEALSSLSEAVRIGPGDQCIQEVYRKVNHKVHGVQVTSTKEDTKKPKKKK